MSRRVLVLDGHPDPDRKRLCHALAEAYGDGARETGNAVRTLTLAEMQTPMLRTAQEFSTAPLDGDVVRTRDDLLWCEHLALVFPLWLGGAPALLRALFEQLARASFMAETAGKGITPRLKGRSARVIVTMGMPALAYRFIFHEHGVRNITQGVLGFAGIAPVRCTLLGAVESVSADEIKRRIAMVRQLGCRVM